MCSAGYACLAKLPFGNLPENQNIIMYILHNPLGFCNIFSRKSQDFLVHFLNQHNVITSRAVSNGTNIMSVLVKLTNKRDCKVWLIKSQESSETSCSALKVGGDKEHYCNGKTSKRRLRFGVARSFAIIRKCTRRTFAFSAWNQAVNPLPSSSWQTGKRLGKAAGITTKRKREELETMKSLVLLFDLSWFTWTD